MSGSTLTFKKAIHIIAVTLILLITILAFIYVVPIILRPTWHDVATFSGTFQGFDTENTDGFHISSDHWRLHWEVRCEEPPPEDVEFVFIVIGRDSDLLLGAFKLRKVWLEDFRGARVQAHKGEGAKWSDHDWGIEYITGSGDFFVRIIGVSVDWEITVEAYY